MLGSAGRESFRRFMQASRWSEMRDAMQRDIEFADPAAYFPAAEYEYETSPYLENILSFGVKRVWVQVTLMLAGVLVCTVPALLWASPATGYAFFICTMLLAYRVYWLWQKLFNEEMEAVAERFSWVSECLPSYAQDWAQKRYSFRAYSSGFEFGEDFKAGNVTYFWKEVEPGKYIIADKATGEEATTTIGVVHED